GQETLDRVLTHPALELYALGSDSLAGDPAAALDPRLGRNGWSRMPRFITNEAALSCGADVVFVCLPHEEAAAIRPPARGIVIALSGGHRFADATAYASWYGFEHPHPDDLESWSYGLPEVCAPNGRLVANPGCYATAALLALAPVAGSIDPGSVVVEGMSGMTGAGRALRAASHAGVVLENVAPYRVGRHPHAPEISARLPGDVRASPLARASRAPRHLRHARRECRRPPCRARGALRREPCRGRPPGGGRAGTGARSADGRRRDRRLRGQAHGRRDRHL